jgi:carbon monoxide dehydrogenase subunit G
VNQLRPVQLDFLDEAPIRLVFETTIASPPDPVFAALSADPATWTKWFPGLRSGGYEGDPPYGVGTKRWVKPGRTVYRETIMAWDRPTRWTYRVDETNASLAKALIEEWAVAPAPGGATVRWTFAIDPRILFRALQPIIRPVMSRLFRRAMRNLSDALA